MTLAAVWLWGRRIGAVRWDADTHLAAFDYDPDFVGSGIEPSPIVMPLARTVYQFPGLPERTFRGLPGMLADSLPDRFGSALIDAWLASEGRVPESFDPVERLCYVGRRGMGALEYEPALGPDDGEGRLEVEALVRLARRVLDERTALRSSLRGDERAVSQILRVGTSAGGARAKAIVALNEETGEVRSGQARLPPGFGHWIVKFDGVASADGREEELGSPEGHGLVELAYSRMARAAGIDMTECRVLEDGERRHFMTRRFDRTADGGKLHLQSLGALGHFDYNAPGTCSQEQAVHLMRRLGVPRTDVAEQFRRAVFNVVARNQDDHVKNVSFLMDRRGRWRLSPAYDVTWAYNPAGAWTSVHQMSLAGKRDGFDDDDLLAFARTCDLRPAAAIRTIDEVRAAVADWPRFARDAGVERDRVDAIRATLRLS